MIIQTETKSLSKIYPFSLVALLVSLLVSVGLFPVLFPCFLFVLLLAVQQAVSSDGNSSTC